MVARISKRMAVLGQGNEASFSDCGRDGVVSGVVDVSRVVGRDADLSHHCMQPEVTQCESAAVVTVPRRVLKSLGESGTGVIVPLVAPAPPNAPTVNQGPEPALPRNERSPNATGRTLAGSWPHTWLIRKNDIVGTDPLTILWHRHLHARSAETGPARQYTTHPFTARTHPHTLRLW